MEFPTSSTHLNYFASQCKICLKDGHGQHFGLETCRACAAFFRRTVVLNRKYKCQKRNGKCEIGEEKLLCKFCRFKKCIELGMTTDNVRTDQLIKNDEKSLKNSGISSELVPITSSPGNLSEISEISEKSAENRVENRVEYSILHPKTREPAMLIDVNAIIKRSRNVLDKYYVEDEDSIGNLNALERMVYSLKKLREKQNFNPEFFKNIKFYEMFGMWEKQMVDTAEWLMHSNEFRNLPPHERVAIFKIVWAVWRRFERYTMTAKIFGQKCYDEKILVHSHQSAARFGEYWIDYSNVSNHDFEAVNNVFGGKMIQYFDIIVKPYLELKLTTTEVTFILCQIIWNYAGRRLQGQTQSAGERFLAEISDNLHEYYKKNSKKTENSQNSDKNEQNYAGRLTKMMQIVNQMLNIQLKREATMDMAMLFDMFNIVLTEPEFFRV